MTLCNKIIRGALLGVVIIGLGFDIPAHAVVLKGTGERLARKQLSASSRVKPTPDSSSAAGAWQNVTSALRGAANGAAQATVNLGSAVTKTLVAGAVIASSMTVASNNSCAAPVSPIMGNAMVVHRVPVLTQVSGNQHAYNLCDNNRVPIQEVCSNGTFTNLERAVGKKHDDSWRTGACTSGLRHRRTTMNGSYSTMFNTTFNTERNHVSQPVQESRASSGRTDSKNTNSSSNTGTLALSLAALTGVGIATNTQKVQEAKKKALKQVARVGQNKLTPNKLTPDKSCSTGKHSTLLSASNNSCSAYEGAGEIVNANNGATQNVEPNKVSVKVVRQVQQALISPISVQEPVQEPVQENQEARAHSEIPAQAQQSPAIESAMWPVLKDGAIAVAEGACTGVWRMASGAAQAVGLGVRKALPIDEQRVTDAVTGGLKSIEEKVGLQSGLNMELLRLFLERKMSQELDAVKGEMKNEMKETCKQALESQASKIGDTVCEKINESYAGLAAKVQDPEGRNEMANFVEERVNKVMATQTEALCNTFFEKTKNFFTAGTAAMASCAALAVQKVVQGFMGSGQDGEEQDNSFDVNNLVEQYLNGNGSTEDNGDAQAHTTSSSGAQYASAPSRTYVSRPSRTSTSGHRNSNRNNNTLSSQDWEDIKQEASLTGAPTRDKLKAIARRIIGERRMTGW